MYSPVYPTQKVFRVLMEAMSHPGRIYRLPDPQSSDPLRTPLLAIAATLLDHEVTFAMIGEDITLAQEVYTATKSRQVSVEDAHYVIIDGNRSFGQIAHARCGSHAYPEQGATLIYILAENINEQAYQLPGIFLSGPGIRDPLAPQLTGLCVEEITEISRLNTEYPLGVDCIFLGGKGKVMCIPRSTKIKIQ